MNSSIFLKYFIEGDNEMDKIQKIESSTRLLDKILEIIALACLIISVSLAIFGVIMRYFFDVSFEIVSELCRYFIIYGVFVYIGPLIKQNGHIKMDLIQGMVKGWVKKLISLIISILLFVSFAFLFWISVQWVNSLLQMNLMTSSGLMLTFIPALAIPIGMFFGCIYSFQQIIIDIYKTQVNPPNITSGTK